MGILSNFFGSIYDSLFSIYDPNYNNIYNYFFDNHFYVFIGLMFLLIPFAFMAGFYYLWKNPYGRWYNWVIWLLIILVIVGISTYQYSDNFINYSDKQILIDCYNDNDCLEYIKQLPLKYTLANLALSIFTSFLSSIIYKRSSRLQAHLPF